MRADTGTAAWNSCAGGLPWGQPLDQRERRRLVADLPTGRSHRKPTECSDIAVVQRHGHVRSADRLPLGQAQRRVARRHVSVGHPRVAEPHPSHCRPSRRRWCRASVRDRSVEMEATVVGVPAGPLDPPECRRHRLAQHVGAAAAGHARRSSRCRCNCRSCRPVAPACPSSQPSSPENVRRQRTGLVVERRPRRAQPRHGRVVPSTADRLRTRARRDRDRSLRGIRHRADRSIRARHSGPNASRVHDRLAGGIVAVESHGCGSRSDAEAYRRRDRARRVRIRRLIAERRWSRRIPRRLAVRQTRREPRPPGRTRSPP